jgi:hypothetical protein
MTSIMAGSGDLSLFEPSCSFGRRSASFAPCVVCGATVLPGAVVVPGDAVVAGAAVIASAPVVVDTSGAAVLAGAVVVVVVCDAALVSTISSVCRSSRPE